MGRGEGGATGISTLREGSAALSCVGVEHTGRLGGVQDGRREGSLHGEHGAPMERVPWITASIKGLTVTGLKRLDSGRTSGRRTADGSTAGNVRVQDWTAWTEGSKGAWQASET